MRKNAVIAGAMYAGMIGCTAVWFAVAQGVMDGHDAAGMLATLQAAQRRFEWSIVLGAAGFVLWVLLGLALVRLMRHVSEGAVLALLTFVSLGAVMGLLAVAREVDVLAMLRGAGGAATARDVALAMAGFRNLFVVSMVFSALWFFPLGWLVIRCGFLPRVFGAALIVGSVFYFANFIGPVLVAGAGPTMVIDAAYQATLAGRAIGIVSGLPGIIGEIGTCLSLLVYGLRRKTAPQVEELRQPV